MTEVDIKQIERLNKDISGVVALPGDPDYQSAIAIWNGSIDKRPAVVVRCPEPGDVAAALRYAQDNELEISVRGGGHGFSGFALTDGGLMIDLTPMKHVSVDPARRRGSAGGGVTWGELDAATQQHGLAVPGGMISHTGIAGLTLGGGIGWLCPIGGLTCDNLVGAEIVTADGAILEVSERHDEELLWALKGGGGNFGVVTRFDYQLHEVGPQLHFGMFYWHADRGHEALTFAKEFLPTLPDDACPFLASTNAPDAPFVPEVYRGKPGWVLAVVGCGTAEEHADLADEVRRTAPDFEMIEKVSYTELQRMFDHTAPWGALSYEKAVHLEGLDEDIIGVMLEHQPRKSAPLSFTPILVLGGAFRDVPESATAFSGSRDTRYVINITAVCQTRETFEADRVWVRKYWSDLVKYAPHAGSYVNFMSEYDEDRVRTAYGAEKYARLASIKAKYDPTNTFHLNANIKPSKA